MNKPVADNNKIVHGLWIGKALSPVELLCLHSFVAYGHTFHLWLYDDIQAMLPEGVIRQDASTIIARDQVFAYRNSNQFGHGKGSYAGFSDIFRYKLLYEKGGWWADLDVVCLRQLDFEEDYVFRTHHNFLTVGNIMKCPAYSPLMCDCLAEAIVRVHSENTDWHLPIAILNENIKKHNLKHHVREMSNPDRWIYVRRLLYRHLKPHCNWYVYHLMNEEWRKNHVSKEALPAFGTVGRLLTKYGLYSKNTIIKYYINLFRIFVPLYLIWAYVKRKIG